MDISIMRNILTFPVKAYVKENGFLGLVSYNEETDEYEEYYQFYIVSDNGAKILAEANETVWYNEELDMYVWGVTHWGTSWDYVLTSIKIDW